MMDPPREESSGNFGAILAVLCASIAGLPVPFAPVHLLFINLLTDSLPAIALGMEPHRSEVMNEKPRSADESILTKDFLSKIGLEGFVIGAMTMIGERCIARKYICVWNSLPCSTVSWIQLQIRSSGHFHKSILQQ